MDLKHSNTTLSHGQMVTTQMEMQLDSHHKEISEEFEKKYPNNLWISEKYDTYRRLFEIWRSQLVDNQTLEGNIDAVKKHVKQLRYIRDYVQNKTKQELFEGASQNKPKCPSTSTEMIEHGLAINAETNASLDRTKAIVAETATLGGATLVKIGQQNQQIAKSIDELAEIDTILARSNKIIRRIGRKIAGDKLLWFLGFLIIVAIVVIVCKEKGIIKF